MNNHLVPEQRLDKNGRLNTKHVRATPKQTTSAKVPAPTLPVTTKKVTAAQKLQKTRIIPYSAPGNYYLYQKLGLDHQATDVMITASDEEFYSVLSATSRGNAFALLQADHRSADSAINFLEDNGFGELVLDNSALCDEALARKIPPSKFIQAGVNLRSPEGTDYYLDALEAYCSGDLNIGHIKNKFVFANKVYDGEIKLADLKEITFKKISGFRDKEGLILALTRMGDSGVTYTASDLSTLLTERRATFRGTVEIAARYGMETALSIRSPDVPYADYLEEKGTDKERLIKLMQYSDQVVTAELDNDIYREPTPYTMLEKCYDAGLTPSQLATGDYTEQQVDGLLEGITPGVSSGWL